MPRVLIANDHGAVDLSRRIKEHLEKRGYEVNWIGVQTESRVDYPDMAKAAADEFFKGGYDFGIVNCGTGIGISISINKIPGIRCALVHDLYTAELTKRHNNPNFIAFGGRCTYSDSVEAMLDMFIDSKFEGGRHQERIDKMMALDRLV